MRQHLLSFIYPIFADIFLWCLIRDTLQLTFEICQAHGHERDQLLYVNRRILIVLFHPQLYTLHELIVLLGPDDSLLARLTILHRATLSSAVHFLQPEHQHHAEHDAYCQIDPHGIARHQERWRHNYLNLFQVVFLRRVNQEGLHLKLIGT